jgi:inner membrane protein
MMQLWTEWWAWMCVAVVFAILEVVIPAWVFLGFAIGAAAVGGLLALKLISFGLAGSILAFAVLSLLGYLVLRAAFGLKHGQVKIWDRDINEN